MRRRCVRASAHRAVLAAGSVAARVTARLARRCREPRARTGSGSRRALRREPLASGLDRPTWVGAAPGDDGALWVAEQRGRVVRLARRAARARSRPRRASCGRVPSRACSASPSTRTSRRTAASTCTSRPRRRHPRAGVRARPPTRPELRRTLLFARPARGEPQRRALAFGPDGRLYLGLGDGGGAFDPDERAQDPDDLLGKLVALDVDAPGRRWRSS